MNNYEIITAYPAEFIKTKVYRERPSWIEYVIEIWRRDGKEYWFRRSNDGSKDPWELMD